MIQQICQLRQFCQLQLLRVAPLALSRALWAPLMQAFGEDTAAASSLLACHTEIILAGCLPRLSLVEITPRSLLSSLPKQPQTDLDQTLDIFGGQLISCLLNLSSCSFIRYGAEELDHRCSLA